LVLMLLSSQAVDDADAHPLEWMKILPPTAPGQAWQRLPRGDAKLRKGLIANAGLVTEKRRRKKAIQKDRSL
jgi:hypothetical protein